MSPTPTSVSFPALGSLAVVAVADGDRLDAARGAVQRTVAQFDLACSRFRDDSELCALNAAAGSVHRVSPLLLEATLAALQAAELSEGDVDPTVGSSLIALGYDQDFDALQSPQAQSRSISFVSVPGWRTVEVDRDASTIRLPRGVVLDLGATAKALAADHAARAAQEAAGCGALIGLGGDIAVAGDAPTEGWGVRVTDDHRAGTDAPGQWIALRSGGLATSSITARSWRAGGRALHHLIDPASGAPVAPVWRTASVTAASCLHANIASTATVVRGAAAIEWLQSLRLPSRLVDVEGRVRHLAGWPTAGEELAVIPEPVPA